MVLFFFFFVFLIPISRYENIKRLLRSEHFDGNIFIKADKNTRMARIYKNIEVYNLAYDFVFEIYNLTKEFPANENDNLVWQMRRAAVSIPLNIAEGSTRHSEKAFLSFLTYAYGSTKELEVLLHLSKDLNYVSAEKFSQTYKKL